MNQTKRHVTAHLNPPETTIDGKTGDVQVTRTGTLKGFGQGLRDHIMKGNKQVAVGAEINTGQFPEGHKDAGKWAIQVLISPFDDQEQANVVADRVLVSLETMLGVKGLMRQ